MISRKVEVLSKLSNEWAPLTQIAKLSHCSKKTAEKWLDELVKEGIADFDGSSSYKLNRNAVKVLRAKVEKLQEDLNVLKRERRETDLRFNETLSKLIGLNWKEYPEPVKYYRQSMAKFDNAKKVWEKELEEARMELRKLEELSKASRKRGRH